MKTTVHQRDTHLCRSRAFLEAPSLRQQGVMNMATPATLCRRSERATGARRGPRLLLEMKR
jgi:hypothetical protein